jgi:hypothetical protein
MADIYSKPTPTIASTFQEPTNSSFESPWHTEDGRFHLGLTAKLSASKLNAELPVPNIWDTAGYDKSVSYCT